jgi:hypothetical protein
MTLKGKVCETADATPAGRCPQNGLMRIRLPGLGVTLALLALAGCGGSDSPASTTVTVSLPSTSTTRAPTAPATVPAPTASGEPDGTGPAETATDDPRVNALEHEAAATVRDYVAALNARDGAAVCELLVPGAIDTVDLPVERGSCAASLDASIGYRDPRGLPVWAGSKIRGLRVEVNDPSARVVAHITTAFADRDQPSFEDDIVYLTRSGRGWLVTKPSATLYRAVGIADVPLAVLSPPN